MPSQIESHVKRTAAPRLEVQATVSAPKPQRISALDFTKGALVLIMVLYHWINYFIGPQWNYYDYLRFLTPSFIFITGFMISNVYLSKYDPTDSRLSKRLVTRGLKLIIIFVCLNMARAFIVPALATGVVLRNLLDPVSIFTVFISGNLLALGGKLISFSILVPISYLLMLSGALMVPYRFYRYTFHALCLLLFLAILILGLAGVESQNLELVSIGMLGVLTGFISIATINQFVRHPYMLGFAYLFYTIAIMIWGVPFPVQVVGVPLSVMVIYLVGITGNDSGIVKSEVILLGKYSLFGYISQIAILQILSAGFRRIDLGVALLGICFIAAFALTIMSVELVDRLRRRNPSIDRLYKAVFA